MKKLFSTLAALCLVTTGWAQDTEVTNDQETEPQALEKMLVYENPTIRVVMGDIKYVPVSTAEKVTESVASLFLSSDISVIDELMVAPATEAIRSAVAKTFRLIPFEEEPTEEELKRHTYLRLTATITSCTTTTRIRKGYTDKRSMVLGSIHLTNISTGEIVASGQLSGESWSSSFNTFAESRDWAIHNFMWNAINSMNSWYPLRGHMLEKGLEKGKKQKLKEIYIDLGSANGLGTRYDVYVYTVRRIAGRIARKYIGHGKVAEVMGDDITLVTLKRGADAIKQAFDSGAEIAVMVK